MLFFFPVIVSIHSKQNNCPSIQTIRYVSAIGWESKWQKMNRRETQSNLKKKKKKRFFKSHPLSSPSFVSLNQKHHLYHQCANCRQSFHKLLLYLFLLHLFHYPLLLPVSLRNLALMAKNPTESSCEKKSTLFLFFACFLYIKLI